MPDRDIVAQVLAKYRDNDLYSGAPAYEHRYSNPDYAPLVDRKDQAIAIALKEAGFNRNPAPPSKINRPNRWRGGVSGGGSGGGGGSGF